jgi:predicted O-linked N-acetylglucosamine transferase (SPINDLY family)
VLLDVKGHTHGARLGALARRPADLQLHYLGFPATLGYDAIDGIVADGVVAPPDEDALFHERVLRLPRCYFPTDGARAVPRAAPRSDHGLPEHGLVLACLNQTYKLTRTVFEAWMQALLETADAVLWLYASHPRVQANLRCEARRHGVREERLIFAANLPNDAHLARVGCADLALDTLPCGSHTTAVDALCCGVPLITQRGTTFAGRVGASLLEAVHLPDLITHSIDEYRARLCALVRDRGRIRDYRAHLERGRDTLPLWDTRGLAADIEQLLQDATAPR